MRYPHNNFNTEWNTTAGYGFGAPTSYGFHEGVDVNDNGGGDSDLGKPIYAIADGVCTSIHAHTTGFGTHIHYKITGAWGDRWVHHAHCKDVFITEGSTIREGDRIATVGKSGTTWAHDHWAIKKQPTGIDGIAKTRTDLEKWEDPVSFVEKYINTPPIQENPPKNQGNTEKSELIRRAYKALTGVWVKQEEIDPWIKRGLSLDDTMTEIMKGDGRFFDTWIAPKLKMIQEDAEKAQKDLKIYLKEQRDYKGLYESSQAEFKAHLDTHTSSDDIEVTVVNYPKKPPVSIDPEVKSQIANLLQFLKKKLGI